MKNRRYDMLRSFMQGSAARYFGSIGAVLVNVAISFLTPLVLAETIDGIIGQKRALSGWAQLLGGREFLARNLWIMGLMLLLLSVVGGLFQFLRGKWMAESSESIARNMRNRLYTHLQSLPFDYHVKAETGDLIQRYTSDVETIRRFLSSQVIEMFRSVVMIAVALVVMLRMNARMTLMSMVLIPPLFAFAFLYFRWVVKFFRVSDDAEGRMSAVLQENLTGVRVVRAFGRERYEVEKFAQANDDLYKKAVRVNDLLAVYWSGSDLMSMAQTGLTLVFGVYMAARGEMLVGEMTVFVSYISMLLWPIRQLGRILSDMGKSLVAFDRIDEILIQKSETDGEGAFDAPIDRDIEFRHVGFEYEEKNPVLRDVSFTVKAGQTVAILGATGSGKSTLMHLLQRLYEVKRGDILIGGVSISKIRKKHLRSRIGLVLQEPFLYSRSVRDNVRIVRP
ncbi:MAG: ATP-binding cassette domain-containing protein, partial [Clostridia bacterium]|nr:ATP-binding cassette domain-containing protein [Clostridia bacterium]